MWRLARAAYGDVAHADDGAIIRLRFQHFHVKEQVTYPHTKTVKPRERFQPFIDMNQISFQFS